MKSGRQRGGYTMLKILLSLIALAVIVSIAIPFGPPYRFRTGKASKVLAEIRKAEAAFEALLSDSGQANFRDFFDPARFEEAVTRLTEEQGMDAFEASVEIYTYSAYVLLKRGRSARDEFNEYRDVLKSDIVQGLDEDYVPGLGHDRWGELYQFYPGPWPEGMGTIVFRRYRSPAVADDGRLADRLTMPATELTEFGFGWPAPSDKTIYIWSYGENGISGQGRYDPTHAYALPAQQHYAQEQEPELMGGGDDINNWDGDRSFMAFYE